MSIPDSSLAEVTTGLVAAYVSHNHVQPGEVPALIRAVYRTLSMLGQSQSADREPVKITPPVSIRKSIADDYLISMEDGKRYQALKRHLRKLGLTPDQYRAKWGLPSDYPMVSAAHSRARSATAKKIGLGTLRMKS